MVIKEMVATRKQEKEEKEERSRNLCAVSVLSATTQISKYNFILNNIISSSILNII